MTQSIVILQMMMICRLDSVTSQRYQVLEQGGRHRHTQDLSFAEFAQLRSWVCLCLPPCSRTWYLCDVTLSSRHITIMLFSVFGLYISCSCFFWLLFIMASFCLQVIFAALAAFCCCGEAASSCNLTFSGIAWPPAALVVDLKDVNTSFFNVSSNGTVSYKGRPFFFVLRMFLVARPALGRIIYF